MGDSVYTSYPPQLNPAQRDFLVKTIKDWATQNGLVVRPSPMFIQKESDPNGALATNAPVTLFPSPFPKACFEEAEALQTVYNKLYAAITCNEEWLGKIMEDLIDVDDFISRLWKVHLSVQKEGYAQTLSLGLYRSDYMPHSPANATSPSLKQVEFNTISSSFGGLSSLVRKLHSELLTSPPGHPISYPPHPLFQSNIPPENTAVETLSAGLAAAHTAYGPSKSSPALPTCILFVVQDNERNIFDQLALSKQLSTVHKIPVFRLLSTEVLDHTSIPTSDSSRPLIYRPPHSPDTPFEVTTVYLRCFYAPTDYTSERDWEARTQLERSAAIKCPTVLNQLAGCKIVQQVLAETTGPDHLANFLADTDPATVARLRDTFAPQYDLSSSGRGRELALNPETASNHVLKPQREGGGNNVYKTAIPEFLRSIPEDEWKRWILMELIAPPAEAKNVALRSDGEVLSGNVIGELGIYGTILWDQANGKILQNEQGGWLMRTKAKDVNEGGVATGFSSLDSILLF
ncbi:glutathione synthase [Aspergillus clavatus NRRL 1]|uniref:Glutathione synthetase n=1 Tax=Aspergillus clavatus (strain ATCC 1007 / CBS 513.65 / DSM 816 / NCTC 3887 / NRRL 1 / QM 1276 / 107) TaxID=344612 RepID=A1CA03_ASPCL|nr:glutathione synthetase, putative [Aspergillus clavatus NRRL 1]EAW12571.1 glutathione synthetase, putative [Aspergillus clavatus NRRL 1]